ncbi:MAG: hydroxymethylbilane synthase [Epulopiscium sp. Nuni2H_MBin003]|nr:MAG: hydroxymethylbilane synthase [Epulopiscium sp. Nuni2H_MBin003]
MIKKTIVVGSRESKLAVVQSQMVIDYLKQNNINTTLLTMKTTGDIILDKTLEKIGGKGLFVKELDVALIEKRSDISVHSLKDMPAEVELPIIGYSKREDPRDVLILPEGKNELDLSKPIGTSSKRRIIQLQKLYPEATFAPVRGNLQTRLRKLDNGEYSALVLAAAGIKRLGLAERISRYFTTEEIIPSAGQGIIAIQGREDEDYSCLDGFCDKESYYIAMSERAFIKELDGGCTSPHTAYSVIEDDCITVTGLYYNEDTDTYTTRKVTGKIQDSYQLGTNLAKEMREMYAR